MTQVAKAVQDFNSSISQYGNLEDAVGNFVSQKRNEIYDNWKQGVLSQLNIDEQKKQQMDELIGLGSTIPASVRGGYKAYKAYQAKKTAAGETKNDSTGSDSTGADEGADKSGEKDGAEDNDVPDETTTSSSQPQVEDEDPPAEIEMTEQPSSLPPTTEQPTQATVGGGDDVPSSEFYNKSISPEDLQNQGIANKGSSEAVDETSKGAEDASKVAEDATKIGSEAAEGGEAAEGASGALSGLAEGLGVAADVLGPVALVGGVAYGLYDLFHHGSKKPQPAPQSVSNPYIQTAFNTAGNIVLPSESNMLDTVGGHSVF